jgi:hypothetical protein
MNVLRPNAGHSQTPLASWTIGYWNCTRIESHNMAATQAHREASEIAHKDRETCSATNFAKFDFVACYCWCKNGMLCVVKICLANKEDCRASVTQVRQHIPIFTRQGGNTMVLSKNKFPVSERHIVCLRWWLTWC